MSRYNLMQRRDLKLLPLSWRAHDLHWSRCLPLVAPATVFPAPDLT